MKVSFTGTRKGMTAEQKVQFAQTLGELGTTEFYHGDCVGADEDAHNIAVTQHIPVKKRPCTLENYRAFTKEGDIIAEPEAPLDRNKKLVDDGDVLIAIPGEQFEEIRSGTWSTIRHAKRCNTNVIIIWPNGHVLK